MNKYFVNPDHFVFENVLVMKYMPRNLKSHIRSRVNSSLLYVIDGCYRYTMPNEVFDVGSGDIVYIPRGAEYTYAVVGDRARCIQIKFDLYRHVDGNTEAICFFDRPTLLIANDEAKQLFEDLSTRYLGDTFMTLSILYRMLALFFGGADGAHVRDSGRKKIQPALDYINKNFRSKISVTALAEMCGISAPHFRRLFKSLMGKSPVKYKNQVIMKCACRMLESGVMNVSEVADSLGFPDIYTFSQAFKKEVGVSPSRYASGRTAEGS